MPKRLTSPVARFPGDVVLADPLNFEQAMAFEDALGAVRSLENATRTRINATMLPAVLVCVARWEINGIASEPTLANFPATPRAESAALIAWLTGEISKLYQDTQTIPPA